jgi:hypothetical protein
MRLKAIYKKTLNTVVPEIKYDGINVLEVRNNF